MAPSAFSAMNLSRLALTCRPARALGYLRYPVCYKHAAPLGLNTAASPSHFLTLSLSHFLSPRFPVLSGHWVLSHTSPMMGIVAAP